MYDVPLSFGLIPSLHVEGTALVSGLTALGLIGAVLVVFVCLNLVDAAAPRVEERRPTAGLNESTRRGSVTFGAAHTGVAVMPVAVTHGLAQLSDRAPSLDRLGTDP